MGPLHALQLLDNWLALAHREYNGLPHAVNGGFLLIEMLVLARDANTLVFPVSSRWPSIQKRLAHKPSHGPTS